MVQLLLRWLLDLLLVCVMIGMGLVVGVIWGGVVEGKN